MGMSPSAFLFYGYDLGGWKDPDTYDELEPEWIHEEVFEDYIAEHVLKIEYPSYPSELEWRDLVGPAQVEKRRAICTEGTPEFVLHQAYLAKLDARRAAVRALNVDIEFYGFDEEPSFALRVLSSVASCNDYGSSPFDMAAIQHKPEWDQQLADMIKTLDLILPADCTGPGWHITCAYG